VEPAAALPDIPANRVLLDYLRGQASPPSGPDDYALGEWQLHTHPDVVEQLDRLAQGIGRHIPAYGVPVLARKGVAAVVALGTGWLMIKIAEVPAGLELESPVEGLSEHGWQAVSAFQPTAQAEQELTRLISAALDQAA
jgi:hypothetical protein